MEERVLVGGISRAEGQTIAESGAKFARLLPLIADGAFVRRGKDPVVLEARWQRLHGVHKDGSLTGVFTFCSVASLRFAPLSYG